MTARNLLIITGQEGTGKSTLCKALLPFAKNSASFDAENVGQTNPWEMNEAFIDLLWKNVIDLIRNFWAAGFNTVIAGSFLSTYSEFQKFHQRIPPEATIYIVQLCTSKPIRDKRRIERSKPTTEEWRDIADQKYPEDLSLCQHIDEYRFVRIDSSNQTLEQTIAAIQEAFPEIFS